MSTGLVFRSAFAGSGYADRDQRCSTASEGPVQQRFDRTLAARGNQAANFLAALDQHQSRPAWNPATGCDWMTTVSVPVDTDERDGRIVVR